MYKKPKELWNLVIHIEHHPLGLFMFHGRDDAMRAQSVLVKIPKHRRPDRPLFIVPYGIILIGDGR